MTQGLITDLGTYKTDIDMYRCRSWVPKQSVWSAWITGTDTAHGLEDRREADDRKEEMRPGRGNHVEEKSDVVDEVSKQSPPLHVAAEPGKGCASCNLAIFKAMCGVSGQIP
jgi:hypothetical protein